VTLSGSAAGSGLPWSGVLALPLLFAAGMTLFDTADAWVMSQAYGWDVQQPYRQALYNFTLTGVPILAALTVGLTQLLQVVQETLEPEGAFWQHVAALDFGPAGFMLVNLLVGLWLLSVVVWQRRTPAFK
jgi:high-affinity nickel-transport protein